MLGAAAGIALGVGPPASLPASARWAVCAAAGSGLLCIAYGVFLEPYRLMVRRVELKSPKLRAPARLVHLSDLHVRAWSSVEAELLRLVRELEPEAILMTGDYSATRCSPPALRRLLEGLARIAPTYGTRGNGEYSLNPRRRLPDGTGVRWLIDRSAALRLPGGEFMLFGADAGNEALARAPKSSAPPSAYAIGLYHYPDLVPELALLPYDLLLCGHTHGGQVRLPFIGAVFSGARSGTRFAGGLFRAGEKAAYVSQGIGCESHGLPRLRFLCPPEVVLLVLAPA